MPNKTIGQDASQIGQALRTAREAAGLSQAAAASRVGMDSGNLSRLERGKHPASRATLIALATLYGRPMEDFGIEPESLGMVPRGTEVRMDPVELAQRKPRDRQRGAGAGEPPQPPPRLDPEPWEPTPGLRSMVPQRVYDVAISYCRRLAAAGLPREEVEEAERLLIDPAYAKLNRRAKRELTEDEQIQIIDATWSVMQEVLSWKGMRA